MVFRETPIKLKSAALGQNMGGPNKWTGRRFE